MRFALALLVAVAALAGTATASAPVRGAAFCWDFDLVGTDAADRLEGTAAPDHAAAYDGDDTLLLFGGDDCAVTGFGNDVVHLGPGDDEADAGAGADHLYGGPGNDVLLAGLGPDRVEGGDGDDLLRDERGDASPDRLAGGPGHDVIRALNFGADAVDCGPGYDVAIVDAADTVSECDRVEVGRRPRLAARALRTSDRPAFEVTWMAADLPLPARLRALPFGRPPQRGSCRVGSWRLVDLAPRGRARLRLVWVGRRAPCAGRYVFRLTWLAAGAGGQRVACPRLALAPATACVPREVLGDVAVVVA